MEDGAETNWYSEANATFGDRLAAARDAAGMNQAELAKRLGVKVKTLRGWENDLAEPRANRLQMLAGLLNVSIVWLLTGEGDGVDAPVEAADPNSDSRNLLLEIRQLRTEASSLADRLGHVEKRLRVLLTTPKVDQ
ncbi:XRE family transcriptional regulator [Thalassobacter stenotrophicus]|jgi:transcriptional regulator with XRE-family HTH domain|uniref:Transcriptional repressor DicA n=2 Tax=Thalassobacter stenotrophicus TaxID=266809 RepID=A0A0P1EX20_9RHOB|nr:MULTISPECIES: transcriptional regulator [Thalassobacter]KGK80017.1 XRE family transcriptional regulator [Thalassobacter stenotrophicus]KGL02483.1 XRE family transcriptional regulator [Thalassobacter sp. 16PALIMAR09]PVZ47715.1 transcriptional regulator [Thalassobacter stenotrophicus]CUH59620.1 transcriptional repressor DicA [Thalassobacter stenotrophicus]SHI79632.1 Helix-turn-helix [Thalassobacter stenotrophicus DSM 16310]